MLRSAISPNTVMSRLGWMGLICIWFSACAVKPGPSVEPKRSDTQVVAVSASAGDLELMRSGLKSKDDSLVLNLMQGFRALRLAASPDAASLETVQSGRKAYDALELLLRQGGLNGNAGRGERIYSISDKDNLTLQEVLTAANKNAQKLVLEGDLEKAKQRNRDIVLNRPTLSFAVEDAQWALALIDALVEPGIPETTKKKLRTLHESYFHDAPQEDVVRQVNGLLAEIPDEKLRQHLKKLANRAWERDRRANRLPQGSKKASLQDTLTATQPGETTPDTLVTKPAPKSDSLSVIDATPQISDTTQTSNSIGGGAAEIQIDSLIGAGKYVPALRALESIDANTRAEFIRDRRMKAGERFCDERRRTAAETYKKARAAANEALKEKLLRVTQSELDSCLFYFPETSVGAKVKRNRDMVENELKKLKK